MSIRILAPLLAVLLVAGCADTPADSGSGDEATTPTEGGTTATTPTGSGTTPDDGTAPEAARWYAFAFEREVTPESGGSGKIQSFSYRNTQEEDGEVTEIDVDVTVEGVSSENIRTQKIATSSGSFEPTTVSTPLEVTKLRHELTVVKDDSGERQAGETSVVTVYVPTGELPEASTFLWYFAKMQWEGDEGEAGSWEYYVTPEMQAEQQAGTAFYTPFEEGDSSGSWWGFELMASTYGLSWFAPYVTGEQEFEEGSFSYGGYSQNVRRESFDVGGYTFDGWTVELSGVSGADSAGWLMKASADLPMPIAFRFGSQGSDSSSVIAYELTDLSLA